MKLQKNGWTCGPVALHNAFFALCGDKAPSAARLILLSCCTKEHGVGLEGLSRAALVCNFTLGTVTCRMPDFAKATVQAHVRLGQPVLLCVDRDSEGPFAHWIVAFKVTSNHVWIADSARPGPVERRLTWRQFLARAMTVLGPTDFRFTLHPLVRRSP